MTVDSEGAELGSNGSRAAVRPKVTVKYAQTLDGRIATCTGHSQWISGPESLRLAHELRAAHDAVFVGVGTVLRDNPRLTVRLVAGANPLRVVADTNARTPLDCHLLAADPERTVVAVGEAAPRERVEAIGRLGARTLVTAVGDDGRLVLGDLFQRLAFLRTRSLLVEGGAAIVTSLLRHGLVDRLVVCIAPKLVGAGIEAVGDLGIQDLADALTFSRVETRRLGDDLIFDGQVARHSPVSSPSSRDSGLESRDFASR